VPRHRRPAVPIFLFALRATPYLQYPTVQPRARSPCSFMEPAAAPTRPRSMTTASTSRRNLLSPRSLTIPQHHCPKAPPGTWFAPPGSARILSLNANGGGDYVRVPTHDRPPPRAIETMANRGTRSSTKTLESPRHRRRGSRRESNFTDQASISRGARLGLPTNGRYCEDHHRTAKNRPRHPRSLALPRKAAQRNGPLSSSPCGFFFFFSFSFFFFFPAARACSGPTRILTLKKTHRHPLDADPPISAKSRIQHRRFSPQSFRQSCPP